MIYPKRNRAWYSFGTSRVIRLSTTELVQLKTIKYKEGVCQNVMYLPDERPDA
jgi:hypothetical protein